jgi:hypothetical protein
MDANIIKILSSLIVVLLIFFSAIAQVNILSVKNQESKMFSREVAKLENQKESLSQENATRLAQEIDKLVNQKQIQPVTIGETARQIGITESTLQKQKALEKPSIDSNIVVTR